MSGTNNLAFDNFYSSTLSSTITASDTTIYVNALPTASEGYLVIEPDSSSNREIIYYTSKGANFVTCPSVATGRGVGGTTAVSHNSGSTVQMNTVAEMFEDIQGGTSNTGMHQYFDDSFADYIKSGGAITQATGLIASVTSGVSYINGRRLTFNAMSKTLTASKDTYFDLVETDGSNIATISYTELSSGATGSAPVSNGVHLGMVRSNASVLATIYQGSNYDILGNPLYRTTPESVASDFLNGQNSAAWTDFTPTWTNLTLGNGVQVAKYTKIGRTVFGSYKLTMGTTTAIGTNPYFTPPIPVSSDYSTSIHPIGTGCAFDGSVYYTVWPAFRNSLTRIEMMAMGAGGTYSNFADLSGTTPATWNTSDVFMLSFCYQAAS